MKKVAVNNFIYFNIIVLLLIISACRNKDSSSGNLSKLVIENEDIIYEYENPDNGSHPFWCHGSAILVRNNEDVYVSGIETLKQFKPMNNIRWMLYKRESDGWKLQQADEKGRTREPCPIGILADGRLVMSVNPTLEPDKENKSTLNQPQILEFSTSDVKSPYKSLLPEWNGNPRFTEHSYRTFSVDRENNELILFQNVGALHSEWAFIDRNGKWFTGKLQFLPYVDDPIVPFHDQNIRVNYPSVVLHNKEVHYCGNAPFNKWSRIQNMEDAKRVGLDDIISAGGGRIAGGRFRRLYYTWTSDITKFEFSPWLVVANSEENGENLRVLDMWMDPEGIIHLMWLKNPINLEIRDKFFPDIKRVWSINYALIKEGRVLSEKILLETGDGIQKIPQNDLMDKYAINWGRFQVLPDNRLFVIFHISGTNKNGEAGSENRIMEIYKDGSTGLSQAIPLKYPMSFFFTSTPRGGSLPSATIDLIGQSSEQRNTVRYAKIKMSGN